MAPRSAKRPTLKTISQLSGLAVPTVSRALNDAPDIGEKTKIRIREIARKIGYVPDRTGLRLRTGKTNVVSLILSTDHDMMNHTARLIWAIAAGLRDTRYHMNVTPFFPDQDPMDPVRYAVENGMADAVVLNQVMPEDARVRYLLDRGFPFVTHGRSDWRSDHSYFDYDNYSFGRLSMKRMAREGRRHVLLVAPPMDQTYAMDTQRGAASGAGAFGVRLTAATDTTSDDLTDHIQGAVADRLRAEPSIDGIICSSTIGTMACVAAADSTWLCGGLDRDVIGKEALPILGAFRPGVIAAREDMITAGTFLAEAAVSAIETPEAALMQALDVPDCDSFVPAFRKPAD